MSNEAEMKYMTSTRYPRCLYHATRPHERCYCFPTSIPREEAWHILRTRYIERALMQVLPPTIYQSRTALKDSKRWKFEGGVKDSTYVFADRRLTPKTSIDSARNPCRSLRRNTLPVIPEFAIARLQSSPGRTEFTSNICRVNAHKSLYTKSC
jgi:hypothetical protein